VPGNEPSNTADYPSSSSENCHRCRQELSFPMGLISLQIAPCSPQVSVRKGISVAHVFGAQCEMSSGGNACEEAMSEADKSFIWGSRCAHCGKIVLDVVRAVIHARAVYHCACWLQVISASARPEARDR
jgi:hypothetical protein